MKTKFLLGILLTAILLSVMTVSAADLIDTTTPSVLTKSRTTTSFDVKSKVDNITLLMASDIEVIKDDEGRELTVTVIPDLFLPLLTSGDSRTVNIETNIDSEFDFNDLDLGKYPIATLTLNATNVSSEAEEQTVTVYFVNSFCDIGSFGDLEITELKDKRIDNEGEWVWNPLDDIEFKVELRNQFEEDKRFKIEYEIYDLKGNKVDFDNDNNDESISLDSGKSQDVTFSLRVPADIDDVDYKLFVKAYVKGHENDNTEDGGCIDSSTEFNKEYYQEIKVEKVDERAVIVDMDKLDAPDFLVCGEFVSMSAKIYNIGSDEEDEDKVLVNLYSTELGIDLYNTITDLSDGDPSVVSFDFEVPEDVEAGLYNFKFITYYEYDEDDGDSDDIRAYVSNSKDHLDEDYSFNLKVNCVQEPKLSVSITADPDQAYEAIAGQEVTINLEIENTGEESVDFEIEIEDFESWAEEEKIVPRSITLDPEQTQEVLISLNVDKDVEAGWQTFKIVVLSDDGVVGEKEIELYVEKSSSAGITVSVIGDNLRENWFIWVIVIINVILIIAIILVARRIATAR